MFTTPAVIPLTTPVELTVAMAALLLAHVPPAGVATKVMVLPAQSVLLPEIVAPAVTVISFVAVQPPEVYVMVSVPEEIPVTTPAELTVAKDGLLLVQVPPDGVAERVIVLPVQTVLLPEIAALALTVTIW